MCAMVLAAGRGERMRPLTDTTPKPLLKVQGKGLLQWHLEALGRSSCAKVVVNTAWLGEHISQTMGDVFDLQPPSNNNTLLFNQEQTSKPVALLYSHEGRDFGHALETAGGIARALPHLGDIFWVLAGDVFAPEFAFDRQAMQRFRASDDLAHLWLVPNPPHNPRGDFGLELPDTTADVGATGSATGMALNLGPTATEPRWTYSTIGLYRRALFLPPWCAIALGNPDGVAAPLAPLLRAAMDQRRVSASLYTGAWTDVGTPQRLAQINAKV